jgi:hypothetical protein
MIRLTGDLARAAVDPRLTICGCGHPMFVSQAGPTGAPEKSTTRAVDPSDREFGMAFAGRQLAGN